MGKSVGTEKGRVVKVGSGISKASWTDCLTETDTGILKHGAGKTESLQTPGMCETVDDIKALVGYWHLVLVYAPLPHSGSTALTCLALDNSPFPIPYSLKPFVPEKSRNRPMTLVVEIWLRIGSVWSVIKAELLTTVSHYTVECSCQDLMGSDDKG